MSDLIRIFVGTPANNEDLEWQAVCEYSLKKHASQPLDICWMMLSRNPASFWYADPVMHKGWRTRGWSTPFTALRWGIPAFCKFRGRAIYMDSDTLARADIAELWNQDMRGKAILAKPHNGKARSFLPCVMLMDCERLGAILPRVENIRDTEGRYLKIPDIVQDHVGPFEGDWNCRDGDSYDDINDPAIKLIHYTKIPTQPNHAHARARLYRENKPHWFAGPDESHWRPELTELWERTFAEAKAAGFTPESYRLKRAFGSYGRGKADAHLEKVA